MLRNMTTKLKNTWTELDKTISVNQRELVLGVAACTLAGIVAGLLLSPRKNTTIGSNNGSNNTGNSALMPPKPEKADCPEDDEEA